jgi:hypothetical protein
MYINNISEIAMMLRFCHVDISGMDDETMLKISKEASERLEKQLDASDDILFKRRPSLQRKYYAEQLADIAINKYGFSREDRCCRYLSDEECPGFSVNVCE